MIGVEISDLTAETEASLGEVRDEDSSTIVHLDHSTTLFWATWDVLSAFVTFP